MGFIWTQIFPTEYLKFFFIEYQIKPLTLIREKAANPSFQPILSLEMFFKSESLEKPDMKMSIFLTRLTNVWNFIEIHSHSFIMQSINV